MTWVRFWHIPEVVNRLFFVAKSVCAVQWMQEIEKNGACNQICKTASLDAMPVMLKCMMLQWSLCFKKLHGKAHHWVCLYTKDLLN